MAYASNGKEDSVSKTIVETAATSGACRCYYSYSSTYGYNARISSCWYLLALVLFLATACLAACAPVVLAGGAIGGAAYLIAKASE